MVKIDPEEVQADEKNDQYKYYFGKYRTEDCRKTFIDTLDITHGLLQSVDKRKLLSWEVAESKRGKGEWAYNIYYLNNQYYWY